MPKWTEDGRKKAMKNFANYNALHFWDSKNKKPRDFPTKYTIAFPNEDAEKAFKDEMSAKRDKISKELREIRWNVVLHLFGGSLKGYESKVKVRGYTSKEAKVDIMKFQEDHWAKTVKEYVERNGGTFTVV